MPPFVVLKVRPSTVDTDALRASRARIADRSVASGNGTRCQLTPSIERSTTPARPTSQQTDAEGAAPAVNSVAIPVEVTSQLAPPFVERCTLDPAMRQRTFGSGDTISMPATSARSLVDAAESSVLAE